MYIVYNLIYNGRSMDYITVAKFVPMATYILTGDGLLRENH